MSRSVLITGGGGFVGAHLAQGLLALGYQVTAFDRTFDAAARGRLAEATLIEAPLTLATLSQIETPFDVVIHGAAVTSSPEELALGDAEHIRINLDLLLDCLGTAVAKRVPQFVFLSSSGVFSESDAQDAFTETTVPTGTIAYALAKRCGETLALEAASPHGTSLVVRLGPIYGPHETSRESRLVPSLVCRWMNADSAGEPIFVEAAASRRDWTYAPDLAKALDVLLSTMTTGIVHLTSAEIISDLDLAHMISRMGRGSNVKASEPQGRIRRPMVSRRKELNGFAWTSLADGLTKILVQEAVA